MAIAHVVSGAGNNGITATTSSMSFSITGASAGNLFICQMNINSGTVTISANTDSCGIVQGPTKNAANNHETWIYYKVLESADITRGTIRFTASGPGRFIGVFSCFSGQDLFTPLDVIGTAMLSDIAATSGVTNTLVTTTADTVIWASYTLRVASATNRTPGTPTGYTSGALSATAFAASPNASARCVYKSAATAGTWGGDSSTYTGTANNQAHLIVAIRPSTPKSGFFAFF